MTDEQIRLVAERFYADGTCDDDLVQFARSILAESESRREPVAWRYFTDFGTIYLSMKCDHTYMGANCEYIKGTPLYLALTEHEVRGLK